MGCGCSKSKSNTTTVRQVTKKPVTPQRAVRTATQRTKRRLVKRPFR